MHAKKAAGVRLHNGWDEEEILDVGIWKGKLLSTVRNPSQAIYFGRVHEPAWEGARCPFSDAHADRGSVK
ncbi:hypothetical protein EYC84_004390 [Monilinia fructicola]|uniref:Uncharacterized protein n=1 Tax=Monilinia fructicola TaxID=38448 RepID=A0A5M9K334_MONFR|nr:hypothetical protein EYC84_004390 [Monilinia fructicola]